jgi:flagellar hook-associated protein 2
VQRSLKNYLTTSGLVSFGVASDWQTGELSFDSDTFATAYAADPDGVKIALLGDGDSDGIMNRLDDYLSDQLNATTGFMITKNTSLEKQMSRLDDSISAMETRLEKRQELLEAQFSAMETLMSSLNSQGDYLTSFFESYNASS